MTPTTALQDFHNFALAMLPIIALAYYAYVFGFLFDETKQISKKRFWFGMIPFLLWGVVLIELYYAKFYSMLPTIKEFNDKLEN
jgi:cell shape-determining protein MreD